MLPCVWILHKLTVEDFRLRRPAAIGQLFDRLAQLLDDPVRIGYGSARLHNLLHHLCAGQVILEAGLSSCDRFLFLGNKLLMTHPLLRNVNFTRHFAAAEMGLHCLAHLACLRLVTGLMIDHILNL